MVASVDRLKWCRQSPSPCPSPLEGIGARLRDSESQLWLYNRILDSRFRGNDAPVVMPAKAGIQSFACEPWLILAPMPGGGEGGVRGV